MADLTFNIEKIPEMDTAALVRINGAIDAKTVVLFQERLDQLQKDGYTRFILDMEGIKYVNSTGLGTLVNVADSLENQGGGIALVKIHPKVKVVFDMLGLNAFFKIFSNQADALKFFSKSAPASTSTKAAAPPAPEPPAPSKSAPEPPARTSSKSTKPSRPAKASKDGFSIVCKSCNVKLTIPKSGSFKCPRCSTFFKIFPDGNVQFFERKKAAPLQMRLACTDECTEGLSEFVRVLAQRIGFSDPDVRSIQSAIRDTCNEIIEKAYDNKQYLSYNVVITPSSTELKFQFFDYGKFIQDIGSAFQTAQRLMEGFEHKKHVKGGNIINMSKKVKVTSRKVRV